MELAKLIDIAKDEASAEKFLRKKGILKTFTCCPYCGNKHFGKGMFIKVTGVRESGVWEKEASFYTELHLRIIF